MISIPARFLTAGSAVALSLLLPVPRAGAEDSQLFELLPKRIENAEGRKIDASSLNGKWVGIYFSASWCPGCRAVTPRLLDFRKRHVGEGFEVLFVSADRSNREKRHYMRENEMPWPSLPGTGGRHANRLKRTFDVDSYPTLVILSPDGSLVSPNAVADLLHAPETAFETWKKATQS